MGARTTEMKRQGRAERTSCMNMQKANLGSQLSNYDMGSFARVCPRPNNPLEGADMDTLKRPTRMNLHGRPHDPNEVTRESQANEVHECAQS